MGDHGACPECGSPLPEEELCRVCLVRGILSSDSVDETPESLPEIPGYEIQEEVGRGGLGVVYRAQQKVPTREVALKLVLDDELAGDDARRAFLQEVEFAARLEHPAMTPVYETGQHEGFLYFSSRFMTGGNLSQRLNHFLPTPDLPKKKIHERLEQIAVIAKRIALALHHAHQHGVIHQDIKTSNILLDDQNEPYVSDFGLAAPIHESQQADSVSGSPAYMAPEQITKSDCSAAIDIYALGVVLYELLTGSPPFEANSLPILFRKIIEEQAAFPEGSHHLDPSLCAISLKCLEKDPTQRYGSANALANDLEKWLQGIPVSAHPVGRFSRLRMWAHRRPAVATLAGISILSALLLLGTLLLGSAALRKERNHALTQEKLARESEVRATDSATRFREHAYAADIYAASEALTQGQFGTARELLDRHLPNTSDTDIRGFEWHAYESMMTGDDLVAFRDHNAAVNAVAFSPDGQHLASVADDGRLVVKHLESRENVLTLPKENAPVGAAEIPLMARLMLRTPELSKLLFTARINPDEIRMRGRPSKLGVLISLAWSPDGRTIATSSRGSYVRLWSFPQGKLTAILPLNWSPDLKFSADGRHLICMDVASHSYRKLVVYELSTLKRVREIPQLSHTFAIHGNRIAYLQSPGPIMHVIDLDKAESEHSWKVDQWYSNLTFSKDGRRLTGLERTRFKRTVWDIKNGRTMISASIAEGSTKCLESYQHGVVHGGTGQVLTVHRGYPANTNMDLRGHLDEILGISISPDEKLIASAGRDRTVRLWGMPKGSPPKQPTRLDSGLLHCLSPDGQTCLAQTQDGDIFLNRSGSANIPLKTSPQSHPLSFDRSGKQVSTWHEENGKLIIEWWSASDGKKLRESRPLTNANSPLTVVAAANRCSFVVSGTKSPFRFHNLETGEVIGELPNIDMKAPQITISPDGKSIALLRRPRKARIGHLGEGWKDSWLLTKGDLSTLAFSPDGKWLLSGNNENRIAVHDSRTGTLIRTLTGHSMRVNSVAISPDGRTIASSSWDKTIRLWHVPTWRKLGVLDQGKPIDHLHFSDDSTTLFGSRDRDKRHQTWQFPSPE